MLRSLVTRNITIARIPIAHCRVHTNLQPSRSLFTRSSFFTSHSTKRPESWFLKREWRTYIRPHYYQNRQSLSEVKRQQQDPFKRLARRINNESPEKLSWTIIGVNLAVFLTWQYAEGCYRQFGDGSWIVFMRENFMTSLQNMREGRIYTLLTSSVSHESMPHFLLNMIVLQSIAAPLIATLSPSRFLLFYMGSAVTSSLASLAYVKYIRPHLHKSYRFNPAEPVASLGASGKIKPFLCFPLLRRILTLYQVSWWLQWPFTASHVSWDIQIVAFLCYTNPSYLSSPANSLPAFLFYPYACTFSNRCSCIVWSVQCIHTAGKPSYATNEVCVLILFCISLDTSIALHISVVWHTELDTGSCVWDPYWELEDGVFKITLK